jgi:hypothetical protein
MVKRPRAQPRIQPQTKWALVRPDGTMETDNLARSYTSMLRGTSDNMKQWRELEAEGWRIVQVRITPVRRRS